MKMILTICSVVFFTTSIVLLLLLLKEKNSDEDQEHFIVRNAYKTALLYGQDEGNLQKKNDLYESLIKILYYRSYSDFNSDEFEQCEDFGSVPKEYEGVFSAKFKTLDEYYTQALSKSAINEGKVLSGNKVKENF